MSKNEETVKVMVRVRPMNSSENAKNCQRIVQVDQTTSSVLLASELNGNSLQKQFTYDQVFDVDSKQSAVYDECAFGLVESVLSGYNGTIFAYGQTGCGKTHTMMGVPQDPQLRGIIPNCFAHIFGCIDQNEEGKRYLVRCSYLEIYNEDVYDLLTEHKKKEQPPKLEIKENPDKGIYVKDLQQVIVKSIPEMEQLMNQGTSNRKTASTLMNSESSRSHSIFTIYIETAEKTDQGQRIKAGKLNLVDLAGSERLSKTGATGDTQKEGAKINLSLSALGNVISCLVDGKSSHIPYRTSKLTRLLQDSLGGNTKTVMIAACSPADYNLEETLSTLRYASRAKAIKNKPRVNEDPKDALLKQYEDEIKELKQLLSKFQNGSSDGENQAAIAAAVKNIRELEGGSESPQQLTPEKPQELSVNDLLTQLEAKGHKVKLLDSSPEKQPDTELQDKLRAQEEQLSKHAADQEQLKKVIADMEQKLELGTAEQPVKMTQTQKDEFKQHRKQQLALRQKRKEEKAAREQQLRNEDEMLFKAPDLESDPKETQKLKEMVKKLQAKCTQQAAELQDLTRESNEQKQELLYMVKDQDQDLKFANQLLGQLLKDSDLMKIRQRSTWSEGIKEWSIPHFLLSEKKADVAFPNINGKQRVEQLRDERSVMLSEDNETMSPQRTFQQQSQSAYNGGKDGGGFVTKSEMGSNRTSAFKENVSDVMMGDRRSKYYQLSQIGGASDLTQASEEPVYSRRQTNAQLEPLKKEQKKLLGEIGSGLAPPESSKGAKVVASLPSTGSTQARGCAKVLGVINHENHKIQTEQGCAAASGGGEKPQYKKKFGQLEPIK